MCKHSGDFTGKERETDMTAAVATGETKKKLLVKSLLTLQRDFKKC
ncbi:MAG TPA: hypothetical protein VFC58_15650 [Desulfosporosinus sp.]|nr:hypothetical protein [Desulfosporosinus sp.]